MSNLVAVVVLSTLMIDHEMVYPAKPGEEPVIAEIDEKDLSRLLALGAVAHEVVDADQVSPDELTADQRIEAIASAIDDLDETDPAVMTNEGVPKVDALENLLGFDITAEERDAAWAEYQAANA